MDEKAKAKAKAAAPAATEKDTGSGSAAAPEDVKAATKAYLRANRVKLWDPPYTSTSTWKGVSSEILLLAKQVADASGGKAEDYTDVSFLWPHAPLVIF